MSLPRFANILLAGPCNLRCPYCVGGELTKRRSNLAAWPLAGLEDFVATLLAHDIREVSLTGTDTEPLLYRHPRALVGYLRAALPGVRLSLHTNGVLVLDRLDVVHLFDRVAVSLPSFRPETFLRMTGRADVVDLAAITRALRIPLKVSTTVTADNVAEVDEVVARCAALGVRRLALRREYARAPGRAVTRQRILADDVPVRWFGGNPVYEVDGMEVTVWDFAASELDCVNLFADGTVTTDYLLADAGTGGTDVHAGRLPVVC